MGDFYLSRLWLSQLLMHTEQSILHILLSYLFIYIRTDKLIIFFKSATIKVGVITSTSLYYIKLARITILSPGSLRPSQLKAINLQSQIADATITDIKAIKHARRT
jgi:hypothetical protein